MSLVLTYGPITLRTVQILKYERIPVYLGPTYIWTKHVLRVRGVYNPAETAYVLGAPLAPPVPPGTAPTLPPPIDVRRLGFQGGPSTDTVVRFWLAQPRLALALTTFNILGGVVTILASPLAGATVDANSGPKPIGNPIVEMRGQRTLMVEWEVETAVNEAVLFQSASALTALVGHQWNQTETLDENFYSTITINGRAVFRTDSLAALTARPDEWRPFFIHPVRDLYKRVSVKVHAPEDGNTVQYQTIDKEQSFNIVPALVSQGVTRIEATYDRGYESKSAIDIGLGAARLIARGLYEGSKAQNDIASKAMAANALKIDALAFAEMNLPRLNHFVRARVWGERRATRQRLMNVARTIIERKLNGFISDFNSVTMGATEDLLGRWVEGYARVVTGPLRQFVLTNRSNDVFVTDPRGDDLPGVYQIEVTPNPLPPNHSGTRSSADVRGIVAETLFYAPCQAAVAPQIPPTAQQRLAP